MSHYFLFLESIGTPELMFIALIALIVFGPRKLPQIGRTIGKYTAEFRRASSEFRTTWEREVNMELQEFADKDLTATEVTKAVQPETVENFGVENTIGRRSPWSKSVETDAPIEKDVDDSDVLAKENFAVAAPEVRTMNREEFEKMSADKSEKVQTETASRSKRDWL